MLHVGMPKTGSSYIQGILNKNHKTIEENSNIKILGGVNPHILACHLIDDINLASRIDIKDLKSKYTDNISKILTSQTADVETTVISSEYFILCEVEKLKEYFEAFFDSIEIILCSRRQDKLIASGFNQDVKALGRTSNLTWDKKSGQNMDYWEYCEKWTEKNITVRVIDYDYVKKEKNGLIDSFFNIIGINYRLIEDRLSPPENKSNNFSLSHSEVLLKLAMNRCGIEKNTDLFDEFSKNIKERVEFKLPIAYERVIASNYKESNQKFIKKYLNNNGKSELNFDHISLDKTPHSFSWNPLNGVEDVFNFILKKTVKIK